MGKLDWCLRQKDGISLIEPNENLAKAYIKKAQDSLETMRTAQIIDWKIATAYYAMYFSLYALLMRIGIRCEIHSCTIEFAKSFLKEYFNEKEIDFLKDSLKARIDAQYYVNMQISKKQYKEIMAKAPGFFVKCKIILQELKEKNTEEIRNNIIKLKQSNNR